MAKKRIITQKDIDANPILKELGIKIGWAVDVTKDEVSLGKSTSNESEQGNEGGEGQGTTTTTPPTGGPNPPPDKERP